LAFTPQQLCLSIAKAIGGAGVEYVRPKVEQGVGGGHGSRQLAAALRVRTTGTNSVAIHIPHYWAEYVHDGRTAPVLPTSPVKAFVWFTNPLEDPRIPGGLTPERVSQLKHLKLPKGLFREMLQDGRIIVRRKIQKPTNASPFFENSGGMLGFSSVVSSIAPKVFSDFVLEKLKAAKVLQHKQTITVG